MRWRLWSWDSKDQYQVGGAASVRGCIDSGCLGSGQRPARVPAIGTDDTLPPLVVRSL